MLVTFKAQKYTVHNETWQSGGELLEGDYSARIDACYERKIIVPIVTFVLSLIQIDGVFDELSTQ